jgi:DNA-binding beta-propeller fold protein YncE
VDPETNTVYVGGGISQAVVVIDGSTNEVLTRIVVEGSHMGSSIDLKRNLVYFSNSEKGKIDVVNGDSNTLYYSIERNANGQPFSFPEDIAINAETNKLYVSGMDSVSIIDPDSRKVTKTLDIGGFKDIAIDPERNLVFVTIRDSNSLIVVDGQTDEMILDIGTYTYEIVGGVVVTSAIIAIGVNRYQRKARQG